MRKTFRFVAFINFLFLLGCPPEMNLGVYNNSGEDMLIVTRSKRVSWKQGSWVKISDISGDNIGWNDLEWSDDSSSGAQVPILRIDDGLQLLEYKLLGNKIPGRFISEKGNGLYYHLKPDGGLYIMEAFSVYPEGDTPLQPDGFPLYPEVIVQ